MVVLAAAVGATNPEEKEDNSEFFFACSGGEFPKVQSHLEQDPSLAHTSTKDGEHCLHLSALSGNADIVKLLLDKGANPDIRSNWEQGLRMHPLSWSTFYGRYEIIELLLKAGADVNADFNLGQKDENGNPEKATVLDVIEQILMNYEEDDDEKDRFVQTRNILVKNGAIRYASLEPEL